MRPELAAALAAAAAACLAGCSESRSQDAPRAAEPAPKVVVVTLKSGPVPLARELSGRTRAAVAAEVRPQVSGVVKRLLFVEGGTVQAGQALYELDDARYRAQVQNAQANLEKAQATLRAARQAAARTHELARIDAVSAQEDEGATSAEAQADAEVAVARAALDAAQLDLAHARIVAPIGGRIGRSSVTQGALVTAEQPAALATIQQLDPLYVEVNESASDWLALKQELDAGRVTAGEHAAGARIVLENGRAYEHEGRLQFSDAAVDPATGNFVLRAVVPNPKLQLLPGMFVRAVVQEGTRAQGLLVPQQGVSRDAKGNGTVLVVGKDDKVAARTVHVSRTVGDQWLVEDGLAAGDRVIVEGAQKVEVGATVAASERREAAQVAASR